MLASSSMSKFWAGIGVEVVAVGLGVIVTPAWGWSIALVGLLFFIPAIREWLGKRRQGVVPQPEFTPLRDAAIKVFSESRARGGGLARRAENMSGMAPDYTIIKGDETQILNWVGGDIASRITLFGVRPPSIHSDRLEYPMKHYSIQDGATTLRHFLYGEQGYYSDLSVRTNELNRLREELAKNHE